jgi:7-keto-8-aminopelargonate synthetase-like enzyme
MLGVEDSVDFWVGSTAKGLGVRGGYIAGPKELMDYFRISSRRYVFSGTLPASIPAAVSQALKTAADEPWRRWQVQSNAKKLRDVKIQVHAAVRFVHSGYGLQAGLRVHCWPAEYPAILQCKPREVIWAHNGVPLEFAL